MLLWLFVLGGFAFDFDAYSFYGGGDLAKNSHWLTMYALYNTKFPEESQKEQLASNLETLLSDKVICSNSGGTWFATGLLFDETFQRLFTLPRNQVESYMTEYWSAVIARKWAKLSDEELCGEETWADWGWHRFVNWIADRYPSMASIHTADYGLCIDEDGNNHFWELWLDAVCETCAETPTFPLENTMWRIHAAMMHDGISHVDEFSASVLGDVSIKAKMWELPNFGPDTVGGPVLPFYFDVDFTDADSAMDKRIEIPYFEESQEIELENYDYECSTEGPDNVCVKKNVVSRKIPLDDFIAPMVEKYENYHVPALLSYVSSEALPLFMSHWYTESKMPDMELDEPLPPRRIRSLISDVIWAAKEAQVGATEEGANEMLTGGMFVEALLERMAGFVAPMHVGDMYYGTVDGGAFDNSAVTGAILGLQQKFPDARSGKSIFAFDSLDTNFPRIFGTSTRGPMGPAEVILENNYDSPVWTRSAGQATLTKWEVTTIDNEVKGIRGGYKYELYCLQLHCAFEGLAAWACMLADENCLEEYLKCAGTIESVMEVLRTLDSPETASIFDVVADDAVSLDWFIVRGLALIGGLATLYSVARLFKTKSTYTVVDEEEH